MTYTNREFLRRLRRSLETALIRASWASGSVLELSTRGDAVTAIEPAPDMWLGGLTIHTADGSWYELALVACGRRQPPEHPVAQHDVLDDAAPVFGPGDNRDVGPRITPPSSDRVCNCIPGSAPPAPHQMGFGTCQAGYPLAEHTPNGWQYVGYRTGGVP